MPPKSRWPTLPRVTDLVAPTGEIHRERVAVMDERQGSDSYSEINSLVQRVAEQAHRALARTCLIRIGAGAGSKNDQHPAPGDDSITSERSVCRC